jgi:putative endopeptidase
MRLTIALVLLWILASIHSAFCQSDIKAELKFDIGAVDRSANPCADFYQFACGGWIAKNPIPADRPYWAVFQQMREINDRRIQDILVRAAAPTPDRSKDDQKIGDYYSSCTDEKTIEAKGLDPLRPELEKIAAIRSRDDLAREVARLHQLGADALFAVEPDTRLTDASQVILYIDQSQLSLPEPTYYLSDEAHSAKAREGYRVHVEQVFHLLGDPPAYASTAASDVLRIETILARASLTPVQRRDRKAWYHEMTPEQFVTLAPDFSWKAYFAAIDFEPKGILNAAVPAYLQALNGLLADTPLSGWKNYFRWEIAHVATPALPARFRKADFDFYRATLRGVKEEETRTKQCGDLTNRDLGEAVGKKYVELYFPPETRRRAFDLVDRIHSAMRDDFDQISWMTPETKKEAQRKLELLRAMIGYPAHWRDYSQLEVKRGDALGNVFRGQTFEFQRQQAKIGKPVDREEFYELPQGVEGYHDNPLNVIVFTAGILQPPFFDPEVDDAVNFGLAGAVIGHELSHAFDDKGHQFDGEGNLRNWWTAQDAKNYDDRAACFVKQYSQYPIVDDIKVNGELTLGENIADNGGLQLAYRAFESKPTKNGPLIDGFTPEQRFFLGWAQWRCMNVTEKTARVLARSDQHAPGKWRVNGVVSNMPGFAKAYQCRAGDPMMNVEPCRIW